MLLNILLITVVIIQIIMLSIFINKYPNKKKVLPGGTTFGEFVNPIPPCQDENGYARGNESGLIMKICNNNIRFLK